MISYLISVGFFGCLYGLLAMSLSIQWGLTGLVNFGQVAFFAMGAYCSAILSLMGVPIVASMFAGAALAGLVGAFVAISALRLRDDYLALMTLGLGEVVRLFIANEAWLTGGVGGLTGVPRLFPFQASELADLPFLVFALVAIAATWLFLNRIDRAPYGRVLKAIREDEAVPRSLGRNVFSFKLSAFTAGSVIAGFAGAIFAHYISVLTPDQFVPIVTIYAWIAVMLGGRGNHLGAFGGAICLMAVLELTRFAKDYVSFLQGEQLAAARLMLVGVMLVLLVKYFSDGTWLRRKRA